MQPASSSSSSTDIGTFDDGMKKIQCENSISLSTQSVLSHLKFNRIIDVNLWENVTELIDDAALIGYDNDFEFKVVFREAERHCGRKADAFSPTSLTSKQRSVLLFSTPSAMNGGARKRRWAAGGMTARQLERVMEPPPPDPELVLRLALAQEIWDTFIVAATGSKFSSFAALSSLDMGLYKSQEIERYAAFSLPQLKAAVRLISKWAFWSKDKTALPWHPPVALVELYLGQQRSRGTSAPRTDLLAMN
jgi:hypothetical protein